jgi:hypothetical protein
MRLMVCPYCKHSIQTSAPDPIFCGPHRASVGPNEYPRVQMIEDALKGTEDAARRS